MNNISETNDIIEKYKKQGFSAPQLEEIRRGLEHGVDVSEYAYKSYFAIQMRQIRLGQEDNLDVSWYAGKNYDWFQMEEIRLGLKSGVDVSCYARESISYDVMREIRKGLEDGIHLEKFARAGADLIKELHSAVKDKQNILKYIKAGYDPEQLAEIRHALNNGCNIDPYLDTCYRGVAIKELWKGLKNGVDVSVYAKPEYSWLQMHEIRRGLENRVDVSIYAKDLYTSEQMREIRIGLQEKIDVSAYKSMVHPASDMRRIRKRLEMERVQKETAIRMDTQSCQGIPDEHYMSALRQTIANTVAIADIKVVVTEDKKRAFVLIEGNGKSITQEQIFEALKEKKVICGVNTELVKELAEGKNRDELVIIAEHKPATRGDDGYYEFLFETDNENKLGTSESKQVEFGKVSWFINTHRGQPLAIYHPAESGSDGFLIDGTTFEGIHGKDKPVLKGNGFTLLGDNKTYIAEMDGCVSFRNDQLIVDRLLELGDQSNITGDIDFNGCIHIKGNVRGNVKINATADIAIDGFVENATLESLGNILVRDGANGNGRAAFYALGMVAGKFFEGVNINASVIIGNHFMKCGLTASDRIISYTRICGGTVSAVKSVEALDIGNRNYIFTQISLGNTKKEESFEQMDEIREVNKQLVMLKNALDDMKKRFEPEQRNAMPLFLKLENAVYTKGLEQKELYDKLEEFRNKNKQQKNSKLIVHGTMYEGTVIIINDDRLENRKLSDVIISNPDHEMNIEYCKQGDKQ